MKIFMATEFLTNTITVRIDLNDSYICLVDGKRCDDMGPVYGVEFTDNDVRKLMNWLKQHVDEEFK